MNQITGDMASFNLNATSISNLVLGPTWDHPLEKEKE